MDTLTFILILLIASALGLWAINTLFLLAIPYTLTNWAAVMVLLFIARGALQ